MNKFVLQLIGTEFKTQKRERNVHIPRTSVTDENNCSNTRNECESTIVKHTLIKSVYKRKNYVKRTVCLHCKF